MLVLVIDTSSAAVVAAVVDVPDLAGRADVAVLAARSPLAARGHGELLSPNIADCLADAGARPRNIGAVVAGTGPGPYTSLRVGLATAAAFADAVGAPTYGVSPLDAIALACADEPALLVATDARRREVYHARYAHGRRTDDIAVDRPAEVDVGGITAAAGAGGELYADVWPQLRRRPERYPEPDALARRAADRVRAHAPSEPLIPAYLRRPDAVVPGTRKMVTQ
ncbi:tRNA (adenosine(37)-N6)-threonylcarbamoyltransferase complex dimerization subunit type 1 TsaB [uncultured Jatrophihabitans sp.]|uniref:tRNA (adenosine(37)-N6)-threonylcarbamoyltransferase complex dimerization subunit type 1 TsaB n=1 Tax=uncultured Jatrophihabitans sp. TaxID=1610747 RepID=UPI0035CAC4B9